LRAQRSPQATQELRATSVALATSSWPTVVALASAIQVQRASRVEAEVATLPPVVLEGQVRVQGVNLSKEQVSVAQTEVAVGLPSPPPVPVSSEVAQAAQRSLTLSVVMVAAVEEEEGVEELAAEEPQALLQRVQEASEAFQELVLTA